MAQAKTKIRIVLVVASPKLFLICTMSMINGSRKRCYICEIRSSSYWSKFPQGDKVWTQGFQCPLNSPTWAFHEDCWSVMSWLLFLRYSKGYMALLCAGVVVLEILQVVRGCFTTIVVLQACSFSSVASLLLRDCVRQKWTKLAAKVEDWTFVATLRKDVGWSNAILVEPFF